MSYRIFIGDWGDDGSAPDWVNVDVRGLSWDAARQQLLEWFAAFENDTCEDCRDDAASGRDRLMNAPPGTFEAQVDGNDYVIIDESAGATS